MKWRANAYEADLLQVIDVRRLAWPTKTEIEDADESGYFVGNCAYQDLVGLSAQHLSTVLKIERAIVERFMAADDINAAAEAFDDERLEADSPEDELFGLDVGVASAVVAVSALGGIPVASCNAGGFGGLHQAQQPYVAAFLPVDHGPKFERLAVAAAVGVVVGDDGLVRVYGRSDLDLMRFAELALAAMKDVEVQASV
ncbi:MULTISPECIES: hypothetical protein [Hansschlegelia]|uniref:Uncharacterized protein n=1 Tax=Hansschlegelia zhihuaiae TaxID=405005 RepID=A0A4Q0ME33_9HYPH|nr:hypothetical protein [Hansschlegelia zhihuaiae]RXF71525.1 hypothetical protein EK403_15810 [Hansschlegelia zhihuaiae]